MNYICKSDTKEIKAEIFSTSKYWFENYFAQLKLYVTPYYFDSYQTLRALENRLDKANLKLHEAEHINRTYLAIREQMIKDSLTFGNDLDALEADIEKQKQELKELQVMNNDAQVSRDAAKVLYLSFLFIPWPLAEKP